MTKTGKYTVNQVEERTHVPAGTLRQWERRYGVPLPERSDSGYRLYSEDDLRSIEAMKDHIADGVPASRAAELVRRAQLPDHGAHPAEHLRSKLVEALAALDEEAADRVLGEAHALHPVETVIGDVIAGAMVDVGERWHEGTLATTTEHFASSYVQGWLRHLMSLSAAHAFGPAVIVACAPHDQHELGALMLAVLLRRAGYRVFYVGANTPVEDLRAMAEGVRPDCVMVSASSPESIALLVQRKGFLRGLAPHLVFGGAAFDADPSRAEALGGIYLADDVRDAVTRLDALFQGRSGSPS